MGKVRIKTLGIEELEAQEKQKEKVKKEQKKARKAVHIPGMKGGERVVAVGPTEEELEQLSVVGSPLSDSSQSVDQLTGQQKTDHRKPRQRGRRYLEALTLVDRTRAYPLSEALQLLKKVSASWRIDGTVELHINTLEKGVSGQLTLPHGTGKTVRVAIADDKLIASIEQGKIDFDVLLAHPSLMGKLAKVARVLGPRGLMPNPKSGTISENPERLAANYAKGQIHFRTEPGAPIIHLTVGKLSMKEKELAENIQVILSAIGPQKIRNVTLKSTMSPGIKVSVS